MRKTTGNKISEVLRIRHFVMNIIYRSGGRSVMIPSSRELAARFGMARSTVQLSLERMSAEGFLTGRPGIGTFTNPRKSFILQPGEVLPLTGIKIGTGDHFYHLCTSWRMFSEAGNALVDSGCTIHPMAACSSTPETIRREIRDAFLDGILFLGTPAPVVREAAAVLPSVSIGKDPVPEVDSVVLDARKAAAELACRLRSAGRTRILLQHDADFPPPPFAAVRDILENGGFDLSFLNVKEGDFPSEFRNRLLSWKPQALLIYSQYAGLALRFLAECGETPEKIWLVSAEDLPRSGEFPGFYFLEPRKEAAESAAAMLIRKMRGTKEPAESKHHDIRLICNLQQ